jgi:hypothetical protein
MPCGDESFGSRLKVEFVQHLVEIKIALEDAQLVQRPVEIGGTTAARQQLGVVLMTPAQLRP